MQTLLRRFDQMIEEKQEEEGTADGDWDEGDQMLLKKPVQAGSDTAFWIMLSVGMMMLFLIILLPRPRDTRKNLKGESNSPKLKKKV